MRLHNISGDEVVLLYDYTSGDRPRVGDSYCLEETGGGQALVVQIVALETFNYPSLNEVLMRQIMEDSYGDGQVQTFAAAANAPSVENLGLAKGKIRRLISADKEWGIWNGYVPSRNVEITRIDDDVLFEAIGIHSPSNPLTLGKTRSGRPFAIAGRKIEKINVIAAMKGMGKSHLAKVIILELMKHGMVSVVFDINREYYGLPELQIAGNSYSAYANPNKLPDTAPVTEAGTVILSAGRNFQFTIERFGRRAFIRLFAQLNPTETTLNTFEARINEMFDQLEQIDIENKQRPPNLRRPRTFLNLNYVRSRFPDTMNEMIRTAIMDRLDIIESYNLFAENADEGDTFEHAYRLCSQNGGAIVVDLARLTGRVGREAFVGATLDTVQEIRHRDMPLPFVFFEEAHLYASGERIENIVTRARHLGVTSTFVTNMVTQLDETILRQVDNLFLLYLPHKDDVRHVSRSATTDEETVSAFAQRIERHHAMLVGAATANYPLVFSVDSLDGIDTGGRTRYAFEE